MIHNGDGIVPGVAEEVSLARQKACLGFSLEAWVA